MNQSNDCFFVEGQESYREGTDKRDCPYGEGTDGQQGWIAGWEFEDMLEENA
jgi:hypothetical protein